MDRTFSSIKQLLILKLMDDKEVIEQCVKVLLDQETHAEASEHLSLKILCWILRPMNSGGFGLGADEIAEPEDK